MRADLLPFFEEADGRALELRLARFVVAPDQLREVIRGRQARRSAADDDDVQVEGFAFHVRQFSHARCSRDGLRAGAGWRSPRRGILYVKGTSGTVTGTLR